MAFNIGINVVETDGRAAPSIVGAPTSIPGLLIRSHRGIPDRPVRIGGFSDFVTHFGTYSTSFFGAHAVRGFFDNAGPGAAAYVSRVTGAGAGAATAMLNDGAGVATLRVAAGMKGREDPGAWGNELTVVISDHPRGSSGIPAQIVGSTAEPFVLASNQTLSVTVNGGVAPVAITFAAVDFANIAAATAAEVAAVVNRSTTAFRAGVTPGNRLVLAGATAGPESRLVVAGTAAATLGFTGATANSDNALAAASTLAALGAVGGFLPGSAVRLETRAHVVAANAMAAATTAGAGLRITADGAAPVDVVFVNADFVGGVAAITPGEVVAAINRQAQGFSAALTSANRLVIQSNSFGPSSSIAIAAPGGAAGDARADLGLGAAPVPVAGVRAFNQITTVADRARLVTWATPLAAGIPANQARIQSVEFDLAVRVTGVEVERFESLSMQDALSYYAEAVVNDGAVGSRYITITDQDSASGVGADAPAPLVVPAPLTLGTDGGAPVDTDYVGDPATRRGLNAFDTVGIQLLACPETTSPGVVIAALGYCERRGDAMFVGTSPPGHDLAGVRAYAAGFVGRKVYGALYTPWIDVVNPLDTTGADPRLRVPPSGHVLGVYARIAQTRGVWKAPAGDEANIAGALGVEFDMTDTAHTSLVKDGSVNGIRAVPGLGVVVDSSRTLSSDSRWLFVGTRRLFNFVKVSLRDGLRFVAQEPHDEELRRKVKFNVVTPFLLGLWRQGAFGSGDPEQLFTVICDASNNPPSEVSLGNFRIEVLFYPVKPAETIVIVVGQQENGASASEG